MRPSLLGVLTVAMGWAAACAYAAETVDLVKNGKPLFALVYPADSAPAGERVYSHNQASFAVHSLDPNLGHKAPGCLLIDKSRDRSQPTPPAATFMRQIPVELGAHYRLSVWVKVDDVTSSPHKKDEVAMTVRWREKDGRTWVHFAGLGFTESADLTVDGKWQKLEMTVPVPGLERIHYATVLLAANVRGGTVRFDDFEMVEVRDANDTGP